MSKKANPTLIGAFVLTALAVAVAAIMVLGKFTIKDNTVRCVAFFSGSMHGLDVGAPVAFRGVAIGRVSSIQLNYDETQGTLIIPVYMDLQQQIHPDGGRGQDAEQMRETLKELINRGLRAQMRSSSLLTGKQYVELFLNPGSEPVLHGAPEYVLEIPTLSSGLDKITEKLESLPLEEILNKVAISLDTLNGVISSERTGETVKSLSASVQQLESILSGVNKNLPALLDEINQGITDFSATMGEAKSFIEGAHKELQPVSSGLHKLLTNLQTSSDKLDNSLGNLERLTASDSDVSYQLRSTMHEMERAASSIRELTDYLRQNPNALLFGKSKEK
ncbi:MAG: MCE family protein [Desulfobulbaceae bacterium]|nr:MCE family protein [Desulfobulbaceae bacterium]